MAFSHQIRRLALAVLTGGVIALGVFSVPLTLGALTPAAAQISDDAQIALEQYGSWRPHPRFGDVWVPNGVPSDWRPYEYGHWVYTDEWGWYWVSDAVEADWGWVVFHYGRWAFERGLGWFWVPGDEWAPAWVNWRYGDDYSGWAPLPPDELIEAYEAQPVYWVFVPTRFIAAPRLQNYFVPVYRRSVILRNTQIVNRTLPVHGRLAVNPGISPAFVARVSGAPVATYRVRPRVFASTQGVAGAVQVRPEELRGARAVRPGTSGAPGGLGAPGGRPRLGAVSVERTTTVIQPGAGAAAPQPLNRNERGRLGTNPPRAAQGAPPAAPLQQQTVPSVTPPPGLQRQAPAIQQQAPANVPSLPPPPPGTTAPTISPVQQEERREELRQRGGPGGPQPQPNIVRPIPPQAPPPPPPAQLQQRQMQPPPPPPPPQQRQVQPPPPPAVRPPPPPAAVRPAPPPPAAARPAPPPPAAARPVPPPKAPPPKPGEKPPETPK